jgi:DNA-binding NarL/FixJ family response regulator
MSNPQKRIRVLLVDDHKLLRKGLRMMLVSNPSFEVVGEAANSAEALQFLAERELPEIVLMDLHLGEESGIALTKQLLHQYPELNVIGLTMSDNEADIKDMLRAGAKGYLLKNCSPEEVFDSIHAVLRGQNYFTSQVTEAILRRHLRPQVGRPATRPIQEGIADSTQLLPLTNREREILKLVAQELTTPEIADKLCLSPRTVENHRYRLMCKLKVKNALGLVKYAVQYGLVE